MTKTSLITAHHWGTGIATVSDGRLEGVGPHPEDPDPSAINGNVAEAVHGKARVARPSVRKSYLENGPLKPSPTRGEEPFVEVSWEKALDLVSEEISRVKNEFGNQAIYGGSYGWASAGRFHHAQCQLKRFLNCAGGFVTSWGNYSYNAALVLMPHIVGNFRHHVRQATRWTTVAKEGELVLAFGGLPLRNAQVSGGGIARHTLKDDLIACRKAGVKFINVSPLKTDIGEELDAEWLAPRPGSDTAIMLGLAHTLIAENLHDRTFLDTYTVGYEVFEDYVLGKSDGLPKTAEWAAEISEIPAERIQSLAREMASKRTLICTAAGLQRADFGEQVLWATVTLAAMLGQIGLPGGGYGIAYAADASIGTVDRPMPWPGFPVGESKLPDFIPVACVSDMLLNPGADYEYNGEKRVYPDIKLVWWAGGNPFHHHQDLNVLRQAFQRPQTIIVNEISWTATARHADIVLPVASSMERRDFGGGTQDQSLVPMRQAVQPAGEARTEYEIYCDLERKLGLGETFSLGRSSEDWLKAMWDQMMDTARTNGVDVPDFEQFMEGDILHLGDPSEDHVLLSEFRETPDKNPLPTPSGKIEIQSGVIESFGYDDCPGHASWLPPREWLGNAKDGELHLISGQPETRLHSQYDTGPFSQSKKVKGREPVLVNPEDAETFGIRDGDVVRLSNERGECLAGAVVTNTVRKGVVFLWTGAWYDPDFSHPAHLEVHGNPNVLTHDLRTSRLAQGPASQSALVRLERFDGPLPPIKAYDPPIE